MPDILIRRMEMPKTCADCHDADLPTAIAWLGAKCPWAHGIIDPGVYDLRHERHPDCPLVELPPHGDLIDRDALEDTGADVYVVYDDNGVDESYAFSHDAILNAPVIVPASGEAEESDGDNQTL